jgi:hypothetical protein
MWAPPASASAASEPIAIASRLISFIRPTSLTESEPLDLTQPACAAPKWGMPPQLSGDPIRPTSPPCSLQDSL